MLSYTNGSEETQVLIIGERSFTLEPGESAYFGVVKGVDPAAPDYILDPGAQLGDAITLHHTAGYPPATGTIVRRGDELTLAFNDPGDKPAREEKKA